MIPLVLGITIITFVVIHLAPGTPTDIQTQMNPKVSAEARERLKRIYGLDKPLHKQYFDWLRRLARLDFGNSFSDGRSVIEKIRDSLPITIIINSLSLFDRSLASNLLLGFSLWNVIFSFSDLIFFSIQN